MAETLFSETSRYRDETETLKNSVSKPRQSSVVLTWNLVVVVSSWQFISLLFSQHKKLNERIKTTSEKEMQVTKRIDVKHTHIF